MKKLVLAGISSGIVLTTICAKDKQSEPNSKSNVLFIIMDDMNDWVHFMGGNNQVKTPNLDKLATQGITFSNAYCAAPASNPSRAAILTGIQPYVSGVYDNQCNIKNFPIANTSLMLPQHFKNNGYFTIASGKVFHSKPSDEFMNSMWDDMKNIDGGYGPYVNNSILPVGLKNRAKDFEAWTGPDTDFPDVINSQRIIEFIQQKHDKPFFAAMGFYRPHNPYTAPKRYFDMYDLNEIKRPVFKTDDLNDVPQYAIDNFVPDREYTALLSNTSNLYEQMIRAYMACVSFTDDRVGMLLDALENSPNADNTIIVLIGDNGFHHGEKEHWTKFALWREACHVPFLIIPSKNELKQKRGLTCTLPVGLIDIYPTLIDMCKLTKVENQLAGNNISPLIKNPKLNWEKPCITTYLGGNFVIHVDKWNYIRYNDGTKELYNLQRDENEFDNLANKAKYRSKISELDKFLPKTWYTEKRNKPKH